MVAGVGGQGVLSVATIIAAAARSQGLEVKQAEVHGMAQRGGAVHATLRVADTPIASELVSQGSAHLIIGMEPVEALRHLTLLAPDGVLLTSSDPMPVPGYPTSETVEHEVAAIGGHLVAARQIARDAGSPRSSNVVMIGAASVYLPLDPVILEEAVTLAFLAKGARVVSGNRAAFHAGRDAMAAVAR